ncbi:acyl transferase/acyl hydrolase/lysophospholipase [Flagelloscypha sp. PMI_526]|nr:acyl transferase/acyl hydrolase/lysophospholipase [Flagelloscypha sp. PMI_526]
MDDKNASDAYNGIASFLFPTVTGRKEGPTRILGAPNAPDNSATEKLEAALRAVVQANTENQQENYPLVSTDINGTGNGLILAHSKVNARNETQALFRTYKAPRGLVDPNCYLWQALRATTADLANGTLSTCNINGGEYWGTSIADGNPTERLVAELEARFPDQPIDLVLSIGAGHPSTISLPPGLDTVHIYDTLMKINKDCEATNDRMYREFSPLSGNDRQDHGPYYRLSVEQGMQGIEKKSFDGSIPGTVVTHAKMYVLMHETSERINKIVDILHKKMAYQEYVLLSEATTSLPRMPSAPKLNPEDRDLIPLSERKRLLALDGGGLLGLSEMILLAKVLNGEDKKPCEYFHLIAGSGTGGIFAVLLGRLEMTIGEAMDAFDVLMDPLETLVQDGESDITKLTAVFKESLEKMFSDQRMVVEKGKNAQCKAFVLANALENINGKRSRCLGTYQGRGLCDTSVSIVEALRATTANRHLFEDVIVGKGRALERFGGTDYANNNPAELLIEEAKSLWRASKHDPFVMSLGAGQVGAISLPDNAPQPTQAFFPVLEDISANCEQIHQHLQRRFKRSNHLYQRFNVEAGLEDKNLWSFSEMKTAVTSATRTYILKPSNIKRMQVVGEALDEAIGLLEEEGEMDSLLKKLWEVSAPTKIPVAI